MKFHTRRIYTLNRLILWVQMTATDPRKRLLNIFLQRLCGKSGMGFLGDSG